MTNQPTISIVIATRNRPALLSQCLAGIACQDFPGNVEEILVVDNSDDPLATKEAVSNVECRWPLKTLSSSPPGVSRAKNQGLAAANGEVTVFLDDDEVPEPNWLRELMFPFCLLEIEVDIVAGDYRPAWQSPRPDWLKDRYLGYYSVGLNWSEVPRIMKPSEWILEGNIAVKTELLLASGGFDERLGRSGESLVSGEGAVFDELRKGGAIAYYTPYALITHVIHADRLNQTWLIRRLFAQGVSKGILSENSRPRMSIPPGATVRLEALLATDFDSLEGEELLIFSQVFEILGYLCQKKGLL